MPRSRIALETGKHSPWVSRLLSELGQEVIVAHARNVRLIGESRRKDDRLDAQTLARFDQDGSRLHRQSTARSSVPPAVARTSAHAHWLPSPRALSFLVLRGRGRTVLHPRGAAVAALVVLPCRYPQTQFVGSPGGSHNLVSCLHLPDSVSLCQWGIGSGFGGRPFTSLGAVS